MTSQKRDGTGTGGRGPGGAARIARRAASAILAGTVALGAGCEKKKKPAPPPPPPPKPKVVTPDPVDVNAVLQAMKPDGRVKFVEKQAPADRTLAESAIKLASALAKGD